MRTTALETAPGPLQRTVLELRRIERAAVWRRPRLSAARRGLRASDALLDLMERCREQNLQEIPTPAWIRLTAALDAIDPQLRIRLGARRDPEHVAACLFAAQELLLRRAREEKSRVAKIIPLFPQLAANLA